MKASTFIETIFAFQVYCSAVILFVCLYIGLMERVNINATNYMEYCQERYNRENSICIEDLIDVQELLP